MSLVVLDGAGGGENLEYGCHGHDFGQRPSHSLLRGRLQTGEPDSLLCLVAADDQRHPIPQAAFSSWAEA